MEKAGVLRKTVNDQEQEKEGSRAETDEKTAKAPGYEELLTLLIRFQLQHTVTFSFINTHRVSAGTAFRILYCA